MPSMPCVCPHHFFYEESGQLLSATQDFKLAFWKYMQIRLSAQLLNQNHSEPMSQSCC